MTGRREKQRRTVSLDDDLDDWLGNDGRNASELVNRLVREYRNGGRAENVALGMRLEDIEHRLEQERAEVARAESRIERLERERSRIEDELKRRRERVQAVVDETVARIEDGRFPERNLHPSNPAVENWAAEAEMSARQFVATVDAELA